MKKKILLALILVATFFMCISLILNNNNTYSIYRETLNTKVYLSVISSGDQIKVEFDANGGESVPDTYREYNQAIGVLPVTEQTGYNFIGWYTERDGGTKVHPSDVITAPVTYYAHWAKLVCKKAASNTLHQETCDTNGGCTKLTGEFAYELGDPITYGTPAGTGIPVTGNAYDCDVDNNGVFDPVHERFYYIRDNVGDDYQNAVLVHYTSFDEYGQMDSSSSRGSYQFEAGKGYLPDSTTWSNPALISFDTKVSRYINHTDIEKACGEPIIYNNANYLGRCQYLLENSRFQAKASGRAGIWVDKIPGSDTLYRIHSEAMSIQVPDKVTSENTVRPVIEIPFNTIDGFKERESFNVTFDSVGGTPVPSEARYDGEEIGTLPTTTKDGLTFGGWYTDTTYQTEVTSSTVITSTTTFYAKWIKPLDDLKYLFYIPGSCTFGGSSTVNITSSTNDCISIVNPTDTPIDYTATANKYINTGVKLYITENKSKDYEIGFTLVNYDPSIQMRQATIMNTKLESTGYPGLVFRRFDETDKLDLSSRTTSAANTQLQIPSDGVEDVKIYRIYNEETEVQEIFYSINNGEKIKANDLSQNNPTFNTDVWFGATPKDANANTAQRYFKGTLSNMYIKIKDNSITKNTVTFNAHGGESDYAEKEVQQGATVGDLPNASKPGYEFDGWYTAETGGTKITTSTVVNSDITYHAQWKEKFIVSFNANSDGDDVTISQSAFEVIDGESIGAENLPTATRDGYGFDGWYTDPDNGTQITGNEVITNDTDYYAHWVLSSTPTTVTYNLSSDNMNTWTTTYKNLFNISYDNSTHMSTVSITGQVGDWEHIYISLNTVANKEYTFTFDYQNPYGYQEYSDYGGIGVQATTNSPSGNNVNAYQLAKINLPGAQNATTESKTLTFTATGTTTYITFNFGMAEDETTTTVLLGNFKLVETLNKGETLSNSVTQITKSGYTFDGYYTAQTSGTQITSSTTVPNQDTTYYAHWARSADSLVKTVTPSYYIYDGTAKTPVITLSDEEQTFTNGTDYTVSYSNNTNVGTATATINIESTYNESMQANYGGSTSITYYINNATLTFNKGNCSLISGSTTLYTKKNDTKVYTGIRNTSAIGAIPTASKTDYTFQGWYTAVDGTKVINADGTFTGSAVTGYTDATSWQTTEDKTLYARCEHTIANTLTANANGGTISATTGWTGTGNTATKSITAGSEYGTLPTVTREGYIVSGWSILPEGYTPVEYIQSTGTQWIDTGADIFNKDGHEITIDLEPTSIYNFNQLFGSTYDDDTFESWINSSGQLNGRYNYKTYGATSSISAGNRYLVDYIKDGTNLYKYVNETYYSGGVTDVATASTNATLLLFKSGTYYSRYKLYNAKLYANGTMIRDFIPCINDTTGKAGLYDLVNGVFYGNENTSGDDFTIGPVKYITSSSLVEITMDHTIYAHWVSNGYEITYSLNNGIVSIPNPTQYSSTGAAITLNNPTKTLTFVGNPNATSGANAASGDVTIGSNTSSSQTFAGWSGTGLSENTTTVTIPTGSTGDRSYTAHWTAVAGTLPTVTRSGYTCGWNTSNSGTTIEYSSGGTFPTTDITEDMSATVNLYAVCTPLTNYSITYSLNNGTVATANPTQYNQISESITLNNPTKTLTFVGNPNATSGANAASGDVTIGSNTSSSQTFAGWTGSNGSTAQTSVTIPTGSTGDRSYTAHWTAVAGTLPTVTRIGYVCGWSTSSSGTTIEYASGATYPTSAITESMSATVNLYAVCNQADYTAMIGNTGYDTVQAAINAVPENGSTPTTIVVLKDLLNQTATKSAPFAYIDNGRNIYMDLQGHTISVLSTNDNPKTVHINNGYLEVTNGTITTASTQGTVEISANGTFRVHDATIANTSAKAQAIFNSSGTVYIEDGAVLTNKTIASGNNRRAAVHNYGTGGTIYITGGTITSTNFAGVYNERGYLIIGTQGGGVSNTSPVIQGKTYGVTAVATYKFYDGIIKGETGAVAVATSAGGYAPPSTETIDTGETKISEYEANTTKINEVVGNYKVLYLQSNSSDYTITLDARGGTVSKNSLTVTPGAALDDLPDPSKGLYSFTGWRDLATDQLVTNATVPDGDMDLYATWSYTPTHKTFNIINEPMTAYFSSISTWKNTQNTFQSNMDTNFSSYDCLECDRNSNKPYNNCDSPQYGTVQCDRPKGFATGVTGGLNVYIAVPEVVNQETTWTKSNVQASYVTVTNDGKIYDMIPGMTYYWESTTDNNIYGTVTVSGNRRIVDGGDIRNIRDLGGMEVDVDGDGTADGTLKYGILFRGPKLNSASDVQALRDLGITEEVDLRGNTSGNKLSENYQPREIVNYEIDKENYPTNYTMLKNALTDTMEDVVSGEKIYFHCAIGTDRTGTLAWFLEGLLGVGEEDRLEDYELSYFYGLLNRHRFYSTQQGTDITHRFTYMYNLYDTNTKIYNYYTDNNPTQEEINLINNFRDAMIDYY